MASFARRIFTRAAIPTLACLLVQPAIALAATGRAVSAGALHACALTAMGGARCWGRNAYGQLGDGTTTDRPTPVDVAGMASGVAAVSAGASHTCLLTTGGGVRCVGDNDSGRLGDGTTTHRSTPADVSGLTSGVIAMSAGAYHTCVVSAAGGVKCWGDNTYGQLGDGTTTHRSTPVDVSGLTSGVAAVMAGMYHTCALMTGGGLKCWGHNSDGQLGDGSTTDSLAPVAVIGLAGGTVTLSLGAFHTCVVTTAGGVKCWGDNYHGQLGDGTTTDRSTPTDVAGLTSGAAAVSTGVAHTCAVTPAGSVKCWGRNSSGELGDGTDADSHVPTAVHGLTAGMAAVAAGGEYTCALSAGGGLKCWGGNRFGELGNGTRTTRTTPVEVPALTGVEGLAAGGYSTCAVVGGGAVKCWGRNDYGQLGSGTNAMRTEPGNVSGLASAGAAVSVGSYHACALSAAGGVKCWGDNEYGQLGDGTTIDRTTPVDATGLASGVAAVSAGPSHSCAVSTSGGLVCWGDNTYGQLGDGTFTSRTTLVGVSGLASGVAAVCLGFGRTCALTTAGGVKCWGGNENGELGDGTTTGRATPGDVPGLTGGVTALSSGAFHTCALTTGGGLKCWGRNYLGQLGDGTSTDRATPTDVSGLTSGVTAVALGGVHSCALTTSGGAKCWGYNYDGELGDATTTYRETPVDVSGLSSGIVTVAGGLTHTCALTVGGAVRCWGDGQYGQLGNPQFGPRLVPARALGFGRPDFDADDRTDIAVYRPSTGTWFSLDSTTANATYRYRGWGVQAHGDVPVIGDFDGDGVVDPTVFRPGSGTWFILRSSSNYTEWTWFGWGQAGDVLVPGDYDGDGVTDAAIFRPSEGKWYVRPSSGATPWNVAFGNATDVPVAGDFDGDGKRDPAAYRASTGTWFWLKSSTSYTTFGYKGWGVDGQGDVPAPGDYDGDGKTDLCVFRPSTGTWYILEAVAGYTTWWWFGWGTVGDQVVPADYDGDGRTDAAVYRGSTGTWYVRSSSGVTQWRKAFGNPGDVPLVTIR